MLHIHRFEKLWLWCGFGILVILLTTITTSAIVEGFVPPSRVQTIDPTRVAQTPPFDKPGLHKIADRVYEAYYVAHIFAFEPQTLSVPVGSRVTFFVTSTDVEHGFFIPETDVNTMVTPGWVSSVSHVFKKPGTFLIACHEYCGIGHQNMAARIEVK
jgi:cytochrome c oxidase subunit 2